MARLDSWGSNCRGQGDDGSPYMSSSRTGVQGRILAVSPLAFYTHCQAHQLNLCATSQRVLNSSNRNANGTISDS